MLVTTLVGAVLPLAASAINPEASRFSDAEFRRGLRSRGLTDLLELYLVEHPPDDPTQALMLRRELKLAQYADETRPLPERTDALRAADEILEELIRSRPDDGRAFDWRLELAESLLYRHGEPLYTRILFRGGTPEDREKLFTLMVRAGDQLDTLLEVLNREYAQLDELSPRQYDRLEQEGYINKIERMRPRAEYARWWVTFYRALAREPDDPLRTRELRSVLDALRGPLDALITPHETSHVQAQSLLLAGMASRLLDDHTVALSYLSSAVSTVRGIASPQERADLSWVLTLALLEQAKALCDSRQYDRSLVAVADLGEHLANVSPGDFGLQLAVAMLERMVFRAQADRAVARGNSALARRLRERSTQSMARLADENPTRRDEIYAVLYEETLRAVDPSDLSIFERCAMLAGLLRKATDLHEQTAGTDSRADREAMEAWRRQLLDEAIARAEALLQQPGSLSEALRAEVLFNSAVAHYSRGHREDAARRFLDVAGKFPSFSRAEAAANNAVQLAAQLYGDASLRGQPGIAALYVQCLQTITSAFPDTHGARYWQYFLAQAHEELGELDQAAEAYERVDASHEHYMQALFAVVRCRANRLKGLLSSASPAADDVAQRVKALRRADKRCTATARRRQAGATGAATPGQMASMSARVAVSVAEVLAMSGVNEAESALERLEGFETRFPEQSALLGRVLRVRVIAYEKLGRLDEAAAAIPRYVASDPANASVTLQGLFDSIREEIDRLQQAGRVAEADRKAASALMLARKIYELGTQRDPALSASDLYAVTRQLAQSELRAGRWDEARKVYEQCLATDAKRYEDGEPHDLEAVGGLAEALYQLDRFEAALPLFNRIVRESTARDAACWTALMRDLQCRTELEHDPEGVWKVIAQHRFLDPKMGGLRKQFDAIEAANKKRAGRS